MSRTHRALTVLALSLALATATSAVAVAAEDLNAQRKALYQSQLEQNLAGRTAEDLNAQRKALYQSQLEQNLAGRTAASTQSAVEDQNDRLLHGVEAAQAERTQAAVEQARAGERSLDPAPVVTIAPQPVPAAAGRGIDPLAVLLLGLVGGLAGGAAILAGWTAVNRRHGHRVVAA
jgi:hypothetical protein